MILGLSPDGPLGRSTRFALQSEAKRKRPQEFLSMLKGIGRSPFGPRPAAGSGTGPGPGAGAGSAHSAADNLPAVPVEVPPPMPTPPPPPVAPRGRDAVK